MGILAAFLAPGDSATESPRYIGHCTQLRKRHNRMYSVFAAARPRRTATCHNYEFPRKFEGGFVFYYGSYRDYFNPNLNGVLRTFTLYAGKSW